MAAPAAAISLETDDRESLWLLIAGPTKLPKGFANNAADKVRKKGEGSYKDGVNADIKAMKKRVEGSKDFALFKTLRNNEKLKKATVLKNITEVVKTAWSKPKPVPAIIYYTGYAIKDKGDWCFVDSTLSIDDLLKAIPPPPTVPDTLKDKDDTKKSDEEALQELMQQSSYAVYIICDCSFTGRWRVQLKKVESPVDIFYFGAVDGKKDKYAQDSKQGGKFTRFLLSGNQMLGAPSPVALEVCNACLFESGGILWSDQIINQIKQNAYKNVLGQ